MIPLGLVIMANKARACDLRTIEVIIVAFKLLFCRVPTLGSQWLRNKWGWCFRQSGWNDGEHSTAGGGPMTDAFFFFFLPVRWLFTCHSCSFSFIVHRFYKLCDDSWFVKLNSLPILVQVNTRWTITHVRLAFKDAFLLELFYTTWRNFFKL